MKKLFVMVAAVAFAANVSAAVGEDRLCDQKFYDVSRYRIGYTTFLIVGNLLVRCRRSP